MLRFANVDNIGKYVPRRIDLVHLSLQKLREEKGYMERKRVGICSPSHEEARVDIVSGTIQACTFHEAA